MLIKCAPKDATKIRYEGILFDNWTVDEYGIWVTVCDEHAKLPLPGIRPEGSGCCDVDGCHATDENGKTNCHYVDLDPSKVVYLKEVK